MWKNGFHREECWMNMKSGRNLLLNYFVQLRLTLHSYSRYFALMRSPSVASGISRELPRGPHSARACIWCNLKRLCVALLKQHPATWVRNYASLRAAASLFTAAGSHVELSWITAQLLHYASPRQVNTPIKPGSEMSS